MSAHEEDSRAADLAPLRIALQAMTPPAVDDAALRRMFRAHQAALRLPHSRPRRLRLALAAAVACVVVGSVVGVALLRERSPAVSPEGVAATRAVAAFQPFPYSPAVVPGAAYSVVRVRIPVASIALLPDVPDDGMIEADLLVGEDGVARGIRFNGAGALLVSRASQQ
jgi:hypothetical protein